MMKKLLFFLLAASVRLFDSMEKRLLELVRTYSLEQAMVVDPNGQICASWNINGSSIISAVFLMKN